MSFAKCACKPKRDKPDPDQAALVQRAVGLCEWLEKEDQNRVLSLTSSNTGLKKDLDSNIAQLKGLIDKAEANRLTDPIKSAQKRHDALAYISDCANKPLELSELERVWNEAKEEARELIAQEEGLECSKKGGGITKRRRLTKKRRQTKKRPQTKKRKLTKKRKQTKKRRLTKKRSKQ